jgi:hypothetical protein
VDIAHNIFMLRGFHKVLDQGALISKTAMAYWTAFIPDRMEVGADNVR